jgi:hypothetical protein
MRTQRMNSLNLNTINHFVDRITVIWNQMTDALLRQLAFANEPKIRKIQNSLGETIWKVYDPVTGHQVSIGSEAEVRQWLDQRH